MFRTVLLTSTLLVTSLAQSEAAAAQQSAVSPSGTRLDIVSTGEATRVPDIVRISAGVMTQAPTASAAIAQNAQRMAAVRAALKGAGIAERDIQTSSISLHPDYRQGDLPSPQPQGYRASNEVSVRFRDVASTGKIIDALVAQGANQLNGPMFEISKPEEALDEARTAALRTARARAETYAKALGKRVARIVSISEAGAQIIPPVRGMSEARTMSAASTSVQPGEQQLGVSLSVSFELE